MTVLMISCSKRGYVLMQSLEQAWRQAEPEVDIVCRVKCAGLADISESRSLTQCVGEWFERADAIVFVCAAGIAVRSVAPFIGHKSADPAVVAVDETGTFSVALLSGHAGGANELAERIGAMTGALPVITTATDRERKFAVDEFARKNQLSVTDWDMAKQISARILEGERIGIRSEIPVEGELPEELFLWGAAREPGPADGMGIWISYRREEAPPFPGTLKLVPKVLAAGIGCRKGVPAEQIERAVTLCLEEEGLAPEALFAVASIDLKKGEAGLLDYCRSRGIPFLTYPAGTLRLMGGSFADSDFVKQVTGVANVCERSALAAAGGRLACGKRIYGGVTVALAVRERSVMF